MSDAVRIRKLNVGAVYRLDAVPVGRSVRLANDTAEARVVSHSPSASFVSITTRERVVSFESESGPVSFVAASSGTQQWSSGTPVILLP